MYSSLVSARMVSSLVKALSIGFPMLFSANVSCSSGTPGNDGESFPSLNVDPSGLPSYASIVKKNEASQEPNVSDDRFSNFITHPNISNIIDRYITSHDLSKAEGYEANKGIIRRAIATKLYDECTSTEEWLNEDGTPMYSKISIIEEFSRIMQPKDIDGLENLLYPNRGTSPMDTAEKDEKSTGRRSPSCDDKPKDGDHSSVGN